MEEERTGLLQLKEAFKFPNSSAFSSWSEEQKDCCAWEHVKCDVISKRVFQLSLNEITNISSIDGEEDWYKDWYFSLNLSLLLPFRELKNLSLRWNLLTGFTGEMRSSKLQYLDLGYNDLTEIPSFLSGQKSLKYLDLWGNYLTNSSHSKGFMGEMISSKLQYLDLGDNDLTEIPSFLSEQKSLKYLNLGRNYLTNLSHFKDLAILSTLETLNLDHNDITGNIPWFIGSLASLKALSFNHNELTGFSPEGFKGEMRSSKLQYLDLSYNRLTEIPSFLSGQKSLKYLNLKFNGLTNLSYFKDLTTLRWLETLNLGFNEITGNIPHFIGSLASLKALSFSFNKLTGFPPEGELITHLCFCIGFHVKEQCNIQFLLKLLIILCPH
ncbi:Leucine-rich repeat (LRR) protein associated with apoptosis in muscle tissue [Handroanthus impetiginosus]|uniref:Leucine-rich repeat (LRR) protein associated with apoptosis in muscle tissue n=1 Tax=Handroanthus impetiginosus TaxID=429701 RepID=A0A2G9GBL6_9LAMI|nr:Leucine-rich repeat (LRR) protein associated with apoptosis in muscle tissue [Handroanthus impetiginosus]